jgi:small subunit ribosomal protein S1
MSWSKRLKHPSDVIKKGDEVEAMVLNIDPENQRLSLGLKQLATDIWDDFFSTLIHISDMSWSKRLKHPSEVLKKGDEVETMVLNIDPDNQRLSLGLKQLATDIWDDFFSGTKVGDVVEGKVVRITSFGAFVELAEGIEGLIHVSEMSWSKRVKHPSKLLTVGDTVESMVLGVDPQARRISLGLKQIEANPWHQLADKYPIGSRLKGRVRNLKQIESNPWQQLGEKYPVGSKITGTVRNLTEFGAFVEVEEGIDGLIHISDMSWSKRLKHPSEVVKKGDEVEAMVLNVDPDNQRLSLGLKQLATDIWDEFFEAHKVGSVVEGKVVRITNFGAFVELAEGIEGLIHVSEFDDDTGRDKVELKVDEVTSMKIIKLSPSERKIGLSIRALKSDDYEADWEAYGAASGSPEVTLGDHFKHQT